MTPSDLEAIRARLLAFQNEGRIGEFVANAPTDIAALLAEVARLRAELQLQGETFEAVMRHVDDDKQFEIDLATKRYRAALERIAEHVQPGVAVNIALEALEGNR
jgi:hypothetical protein